MKNKTLVLLCVCNLTFNYGAFCSINTGESHGPAIESTSNSNLNTNEELTPAALGLNNEVAIFKYIERVRKHAGYVNALYLLKKDEPDNQELQAIDDYLIEERFTLMLLADRLEDDNEYESYRHPKLTLMKRVLYIEIHKGLEDGSMSLWHYKENKKRGEHEPGFEKWAKFINERYYSWFLDYQKHFDEYNKEDREITQKILQAYRG